ncbi:MAG: 4'-phosphopantetheinyl transferase superfamily protein [Elusimicrobiaceae bacterium]|nr:4'-phosphopantetheinyl transferase superfamily protein [Elusimicrobiaceae bacterium]
MPFLIVKTGMTSLPPPESFLGGEELSVYNRFKIEKRRRDWLAGRWAAKTALAAQRCPGADLRGLLISSDSEGRPLALFLGKPVTCPISITHSNGVALCAAGRGTTAALGIDLEKSETRSVGWAEFSFHKDELKSHAPEFLTALWTLKEAVLKAAGTGLKAVLNDIRFAAADNIARNLPELPQTPAGPDYSRFLELAAVVAPPVVTGNLAQREEIARLVASLSYRTARTADGFVVSAAWR